MFINLGGEIYYKNFVFYLDIKFFYNFKKDFINYVNVYEVD